MAPTCGLDWRREKTSLRYMSAFSRIVSSDPDTSVPDIAMNDDTRGVWEQRGDSGLPGRVNTKAGDT